MNYSIIKQLLEHLEDFEKLPQGESGTTMGNFVDYLSYSINKPETAVKVTDEELLNVSLAQYIAHLYRFSKSYTKIALENSPLTTVDDFLYLGKIMELGHCTKTELIELNAHEKTSGMEIIKRLQKNNFVTQEDDPNDGRSKLLSITLKGKQEFFAALESMKKSANLVGGPLSTVEKLHLMHLLQKLHVFHKSLFAEKNVTLDEMLEQLESQENQ
ncbi:MarR family winged helix-turn-helix transcriptional regulator [Persicitalea jodogahamensis]|uniref:HTH marR-type domain-containing protein n=1 Tax=Persicitalea jodogahamensis TaxID=402147 RepID=A0A8J3G8B3_9BACT|nr:MarR family winged helix-turn-helix transcriptional regulator [Persicitalea jodogahamensis]GHB57433.1 hypothetical protein GCM10007390_08570 [Persicitalea jodogahamensis]